MNSDIKEKIEINEETNPPERCFERYSYGVSNRRTAQVRLVRTGDPALDNPQ